MAEIKITKDNFAQEVLQSDVPVLVDFWATWCGPCRMLAPVLSDIAEEYEGKVKVGKINVDEEMELAMQYRISAIPAVMLFKNGKVEKTTVGYQPKESIEQMLK